MTTLTILMVSRLTIRKGPTIGVVSQAHDATGYLDLGLDDYKQGTLIFEWQRIDLETARVLDYALLDWKSLALTRRTLGGENSAGALLRCCIAGPAQKPKDRVCTMSDVHNPPCTRE